MSVVCVLLVSLSPLPPIFLTPPTATRFHIDQSLWGNSLQALNITGEKAKMVIFYMLSTFTLRPKEGCVVSRWALHTYPILRESFVIFFMGLGLWGFDVAMPMSKHTFIQDFLCSLQMATVKVSEKLAWFIRMGWNATEWRSPTWGCLHEEI